MKSIINRIISTFSLPNGRAGVGLLLLAITSLAAHATLRMPDITVTKITKTGVNTNVGFKVKDSNEWLKADAGKWTVTSTDTPVQGAIGDKDYSGFFFQPENSYSGSTSTPYYHFTYALADINDPVNGIIVDPTTTGGSLLVKRRASGVVSTDYFLIEASTSNTTLYVLIYNGKVYGTADIAKATEFEAYQLANADHDAECVQEAEPATCEEGGVKAKYHCSICDKYFEEEACKNETTSETEEIPALGHSYGTDGKCTVCQAQASASVTIGETTTCYATLADAWDVATAQTGTATVKLLQDVTLSAALQISSTTNPTIILDLNDHVLTRAARNDIIYANQSNTLTITDNSTTKTKRYFTVSNGTCTWSDTETTDYVEGGIMTGSSGIKYISGTLLTVSNVNFVGNGTSENIGGAIYTATHANIYNCTFYGNIAGNGGAIYCGKNIIIKDSKFKYNSVGTSGGAIYSAGVLTLINDLITDNIATTNGGGVYMGETACFAAGTMITMADGTTKRIEEIKIGDAVQTFDHEKGVLSESPVFYMFKSTDPSQSFTLTFKSGTTLDFVRSHSILCQETLKYECLTAQTAASYIGQHFYNATSRQWDELVGIQVNDTPTDYYSPLTAPHINCVANGMLTVLPKCSFFLNMYELDSTLKVDADQLAADIATYGLDDISNYPQYAQYSELFDLFNGKYLKIINGKGLESIDHIWNLFDMLVSAIQADGASPSSNRSRILKVPTTQETEPTYSTYTSGVSAPGLIVGKNVIIKDNKAGGIANNVYLANASNGSVDATIRLITDHSGSSIGVTVPSAPRIITEGTVSEADLSIFSSDDASKDVFYVNNQIAIMPIATPNTADYATYSASYDWKVVTSDVKVYKVRVDGTSLVLTELTGYIPAGAGVLLSGDVTKVGIDVKGESDTPSDMEGNELKATTNADGTLVTMPTDKVIFALGPKDNFQNYDGTAFIANRAYLEFDSNPLEGTTSKTMPFVFADDVATAIYNVANTGLDNCKRLENGRVVIIKNGVKYTTCGQIIK